MEICPQVLQNLSTQILSVFPESLLWWWNILYLCCPHVAAEDLQEPLRNKTRWNVARNLPCRTTYLLIIAVTRTQVMWSSPWWQHLNDFTKIKGKLYLWNKYLIMHELCMSLLLIHTPRLSTGNTDMYSDTFTCLWYFANFWHMKTIGFLF